MKSHRSRKSASRKQKRKSNLSSRKGQEQQDEPQPTWVDLLDFEPVVPSSTSSSASTSTSTSTSNFPTTATSNSILSVLSWNVLAQSYCSPRSQCNLPRVYQKHVFHGHGSKRRKQIVHILQKFVRDHQFHVLCLQEVDLDDIKQTLQDEECRYKGVESPRVVGGGAGGRVDSCAIYVREESWQLVDEELIRLDDLATLSSAASSSAASSLSPAPNTTDSSTPSSEATADEPDKPAVPVSNNLQGLQQSFLRRNMALLVRIQHKETGQTAVIANCHLYWHPGYEYVKLCQVHYILLRAKSFCRPGEPLVLAGDLNSKPYGAAHTYLTRGVINSKQYAPWYRIYDPELEEVTIIHVDDDDDVDGEVETIVTDQVQNLDLSSSNGGDTESASEDQLQKPNLSSSTVDRTSSSARYLLDSTLNKYCRWLRILGQDTALETDEEEKLRTGEGKMILFERCRKEHRTLVTTSTRLQLRTDCPPGTYVINPTFLDKLEVVLVHMLLTHGVVLEPANFLSRCVICNGGIEDVQIPHEKQRILQEYQAPVELLKVDMEVYQCDGCGQGYWWCDRPTSSASRVKGAATRLFELCLQAGVPIRGSLDMFDHVNVEEQRQKGWDFSQPGSELLEQKLDVIEWLRSEKLECPFQLESAYARKDDGGVSLGEILPFTNVTHAFVNTLDYIFLSGLTVNERLRIPMSNSELNTKGLANGHLLPSDVWPSDHLCIGARLSFQSSPAQPTGEAARTGEDAPTNSDTGSLFCGVLGDGSAPPPPPPPPPTHGARCDCGCVPNIPSLFEMAELRRRARLEKSQRTS